MVARKQQQQPKQPSSAAAADANPTARHHNNHHLNNQSHLSSKHLNTTTNKDSSSDKLNNNGVSHVRLYVGGLPSAGVTPDQLAERFRPFGTVSDVEVDRKDRRFAHLTLMPKAADSVQRCFSVYNGARWLGSALRIATSKPTYLERLQAEWQADAAAQATAIDNRDNGTNSLPHALANLSTLHIRPHPLAKQTVEVPVGGSAKKHTRNFPELTCAYKTNTTSLWDLLHTPSTTPSKPAVQPFKPRSQPNETNNTALQANNTPANAATQARPRLPLNDIPHATRTPLHDVNVGDDVERVDDMEEEPPTPPRRDERFLLRNLKKTEQVKSAVGAMNDDIDPTERVALDGERERQLELLSAMFPSQDPASEKPAVNLQQRVKKNLPAFSSTSRFDPAHDSFRRHGIDAATDRATSNSDDADDAVDNGTHVSSEIAVRPVVSSVAASPAFMRERDPSLLLRNLMRLKAGSEAVGDGAANAAGNGPELSRGDDVNDTGIGDASAGVSELLESGKQLPAVRKEGMWASLTAGGQKFVLQDSQQQAQRPPPPPQRQQQLEQQQQQPQYQPQAQPQPQAQQPQPQAQQPQQQQPQPQQQQFQLPQPQPQPSAAPLCRFMRSGSAAEVEAEWRAKRAALLEDFKRKRRAAAKDGTAAAAAAIRPARGTKTAR